MRGGGFSVTGQGSVTGTGVLIVNVPSKSSDTISLTGQGNVTLSPLTNLTGSWAAYDGITIFQDPASSAPINLTGQESLTMTGTIYAPAATLGITGHGGVVVNNDSAHGIGAEVIISDLKVTGNGGLTITRETVDHDRGARPRNQTQDACEIKGDKLQGFRALNLETIRERLPCSCGTSGRVTPAQSLQPPIPVQGTGPWDQPQIVAVLPPSSPVPASPVG